ncbi:preprotein translocase subunit YajC [Enterococcus villorum]|uniref:Preprotein translocase subunit YajC n=1 Tax=Enterococcus villorum TaxID=112904 RepID=A0A1V8YWY6_9ENTE|nr:preprotein translocase subunit YajC [Enterococcus villorum]OQO70401.1 preprotein translocase subunit YajC [Enterococcus villorum]OQO77145.1 preprotein translocase subunit YajC [Enterococcus villorum]
MGSLPMLVMFVALLAMWYFMSRTQKKQQQERQNLLDSMKPGDEVVTIGGLHGVVSEIDNEKRTVVLDCEGIFLEYDRAAIKTVKPGITGSREVVTPTSAESVQPQEKKTTEVNEEISDSIEKTEEDKEK